MLFTSKYVASQRMDICKSCDSYMATIYLCRECGCFMPAKTKIAQIRCPKDKWMEVYGTEENEPVEDESDEELNRLADAMEREAEKIRKSLK